MFGKEPAIIAAALAAIIQGLVILFTEEQTIDQDDILPWLVPVVTLLAGWLTRRKVVPVTRLEERHIDPVTLERGLR